MEHESVLSFCAVKMLFEKKTPVDNDDDDERPFYLLLVGKMDGR